MPVTPILPSPEWPDVPPQLLRAINERFRELDAAASVTASTSTRTINTSNVTIVSEGSVAGLFFTAGGDAQVNHVY